MQVIALNTVSSANKDETQNCWFKKIAASTILQVYNHNVMGNGMSQVFNYFFVISCVTICKNLS